MSRTFTVSSSRCATTTTAETTTDNTLTLVLQRPAQRIQRNRQIRDGTLHVGWDPNVVDNENSGQKKSKKCCIFQKKKRFDQSSEESCWEDPDDIPGDENGSDDE